jgi:hypothetical protein
MPTGGSISTADLAARFLPVVVAMLPHVADSDGPGPVGPGPTADATARRPGYLRRRLAGGAWVGTLLYALVLVYVVYFDVRVALQHRWPDFAGITVIALIFLTVPTGAVRWLRQVRRNRASGSSPDTPAT